MVYFFIFLIEISFDLYVYVVRVSTETTKPTVRNLRGSERNNGDITKFHKYASTRHSETKIGDARDASIEDKYNAQNASTTDASPRDYHAHDAPTNVMISMLSKRISLQKKPDARDAQKYV